MGKAGFRFRRDELNTENKSVAGVYSDVRNIMVTVPRGKYAKIFQADASRHNIVLCNRNQRAKTN